MARYLGRLPAQVPLPVGQPVAIVLGVPGVVGVQAVAGPRRGLRLDGQRAAGRWLQLPGGVLRVTATQPGNYRLRLRPFGVLPWPGVRLEAVPIPQVLVGGQSVALLLRPQGALVRGPTAEGTLPPEQRLQPGDELLRLQGARVQDRPQLRRALQRAGAQERPLEAQVLRRGRIRTLLLRPWRLSRRGGWTLGVHWRFTVSGMGTLSFYSARTLRFAALGHALDPLPDGGALPLRGGELLPALVVGLDPSRRGAPGEKLGVAAGRRWGLVDRDTPLGVFGRLLHLPAARSLAQPLPVALPDQLAPGPATLFTVLRDQQVGAFAVRILSVSRVPGPQSRGLIIQVTDPRLLREAGGIVQGMSGSPIVQQGRLAGVLTHVFVDDPRRGFGVLAIWMAAADGPTPPQCVPPRPRADAPQASFVARGRSPFGGAPWGKLLANLRLRSRHAAAVLGQDP